MIHLILLGILVILSIIAVELDNFTYSIISLAGAGITLGIIFFNLGAVYVSIFQILIYGGAITILFFVLINLTEERGKPKPLPPIKIIGLEVPGIVLLIVLLFLFFGLIGFYQVFEGIYTTTSKVSEQISVWVWNYRLTDTVIQVFVLFSALVGILVVWWSK